MRNKTMPSNANPTSSRAGQAQAILRRAEDEFQFVSLARERAGLNGYFYAPHTPGEYLNWAVDEMVIQVDQAASYHEEADDRIDFIQGLAHLVQDLTNLAYRSVQPRRTKMGVAAGMGPRRLDQAEVSARAVAMALARGVGTKAGCPISSLEEHLWWAINELVLQADQAMATRPVPPQVMEEIAHLTGLVADLTDLGYRSVRPQAMVEG